MTSEAVAITTEHVFGELFKSAIAVLQMQFSTSNSPQSFSTFFSFLIKDVFI